MSKKRTSRFFAVLLALILVPFALTATEHGPGEGTPPDHAGEAAPQHGAERAPAQDRGGEAHPAAQPPPPQEQPPTPEISDSQLSDFVDAYMRVQEVRERYHEPLTKAESPEEAEQIEQQAVSEMMSAISEEGMDMDTYNEIAAVIARDPEISARFNAMLQDRQSE